MNLHGYDFPAHVHVFTCNERHILLDVNSGAIHLLDEAAVGLVNKIIENQGWLEVNFGDLPFSPETITETLGELQAAFEEGSLFSVAQEVDLDFSNMAVKALCLNVAHACNMRCTYCFAHQGDFGLQKGLMPWATAKAAVDFLLAQSETVRTLEIDFFGGEPLLNWDVVKRTVTYGRQLEVKTGKQFNFTLTTNGLLLDDAIMDFIVANRIGMILSLDGRPAIHDAQRKLNNGEGSYDKVVPRFQAMVRKNPISYYLRGTFTRHNLDFTQDVAHIIQSGFDAVSLEPAIGPDRSLTIQEEDLPAVLAEYETLTRFLLNDYKNGGHGSFFHYNLNLQQGPCLAKRYSGCGAGVEYLAITPEGDIYPCHQLIGQQSFYLGNVSSTSLNKIIKDGFADNNLAGKAECQSCWARYYCGGGCHANNYFANGTLSRPASLSCRMHRKRIEQAIYLDIEKRFL